MSQQISIIGFGRFGKILYEILKKDFRVKIYDKKGIKKTADFTKNTEIAKNIKQIYESSAIFYAIPIETFEAVISAHKKYFKPHHILIDVLSVKMHPAKIFKKYLAGLKTQALLTHPMFGPDSVKGSFKDLPLILDKFTADKTNYNFWKNYFKGKGLRIIEMTAREHDKLAAKSQGLTHFIGRLLDDCGFKPTSIDSLGAKTLLKVKEQTCNDTWQLFTNLQHFNPYTKQMRIKLGASYNRLYNKLLPRRKVVPLLASLGRDTNCLASSRLAGLGLADPKCITFGIQGGRGSFNEEAVFHYLAAAGIKNYKIKYLYTAENVFRALNKGEIDFGQVAIQNSVGGVVDETIEAMAKYKFKILKQKVAPTLASLGRRINCLASPRLGIFEIKISHALMMRSDAKFSDITKIMSHPQALAQCKKTLAKKYRKLKLISGEKQLIDQAAVAARLAEKRLPKNIAVLGSKLLSEIYGLKIIEENLQDAKENYTSFMMAERI